MGIWLMENISSNRQVHSRHEVFADLYQVSLCARDATGWQSYVERQPVFQHAGIVGAWHVYQAQRRI
jgi:hypothetical protein